MAWLFQQKSVPLYNPKLETEPDRRHLSKLVKEFAAENPHLFPFKADPFTQGVHWPEEFFPDRGFVKSRHKTLPDIVNAGVMVASERLKNLIEELEPGVHQFRHLPIIMKNGERSEVNFFVMVVGHAAIGQSVFDQTHLKIIDYGLGRLRFNVPTMLDQSKIAITRYETEGWHLWWSRDIFNFLTCSDEMHERMIKMRIDCLEFIHVREV